MAVWRRSLIWQKDQPTGHLNAKVQPLRDHEDLAVFYGRAPVYHPQMVHTGRSSHSRGKRKDRTINHYGHFENTAVVDQDGWQYPRSVLRFPKPRGLHPSQKPVELARWLIRTFTDPGDVVLDPVCGSGTTLVAARAEGRRAVGIELHEPFAHMAAERLTSGSDKDRW